MKPVVFVVEDDADVRQSLEFLVASFGYVVRAFDSADSFLDSSDAAQPDCLVVDFRFPNMDGLQQYDLLAARNATIPMIFLTGDFSEKLRRETRKRGITNVLEKPCSSDALYEKIKLAMNDEAILRHGNNG